MATLDEQLDTWWASACQGMDDEELVELRTIIHAHLSALESAHAADIDAAEARVGRLEEALRKMMRSPVPWGDEIAAARAALDDKPEPKP